MPITKEQVERISGLARLKLTPNEIKIFSNDLSQIVYFMDILDEVTTETFAPESTSGRQLPVRKDTVGESLSVEKALVNARHTQNHFITVPRVI